MSQESTYRQFLLETERRTAPRQRNVKSRFEESTATRVLGSLSCAVGIVVLIVVLGSIARRPVRDWLRITRYPQPSIACAVAAVVGEVLGVAGVAFAWIRRRTISLLSLVGSAMCVLHVLLFSIHDVLIHFLSGAR